MRTGEVDTLYISRKFRVLYFFAALAIVLIHSGIMAGMDKQAVWCRSAIDIYTQRLTCWAVPFFFAAAGYWFSQGGYMRGKQSYLIISQEQDSFASGAVFSFHIDSACSFSPRFDGGKHHRPQVDMDKHRIFRAIVV